MLMEQLESRQLLAADFIVDESGKDLELQISGGTIEVLDIANNNNVIKSEAIGDIDSDKIVINAKSLFIDSTVNLDGDSLEITADKIEIKTGGSLITSDLDSAASPVSEGSSGDISLVAQEIIVGAATISSAVVGVGNFSVGTITILAADMPTAAESVFTDTFVPILQTNRSASIDLAGATINGRDVTIAATGSSNTRWDDIGGFADDIGNGLLTKLQAVPQLALSAITSLSGQAKVHDAAASVKLIDAFINSSTTVTIGSTAEADASLNTVALGGLAGSGNPVLISLGYSSSTTSATIDVLGTTKIDAQGRVNIASDATSTSSVSARADANAVGPNNDIEAAFNAALAQTSETSTVMIGQDSVIVSGGLVSIDAKGKVENDVAASTTVFDDGFGGLSVAVGLDEAVIKAEIHGHVTSNGSAENHRIGFTANDVGATSNQITLRGIPAGDPIKVGEKITYDAGSVADGDASDLGLIDGRVYTVKEASDPSLPDSGMVSQTIRLVSSESVDLDISQVQAASQHALRKLATLRFNPTDVAAGANSADGLITLSGLPATVTKLTYLGPDFAAGEDPDSISLEGIAGLVQGQEYDVTRVGNQIKLKVPGAANFIDFVAPTNGVHGFYYTEKLQTFDASTEVDSVTDTIQLAPGHGLKTGDLVFYETDANKSITRALAHFGDGHDTPATIGDVTLPNSPIAGLISDFGYRAVVDGHAPNLIRLATTLAGALGARVVDLKAGTGDDHVFQREAGKLLGAHLDATNQADAGIALSDKEDQPSPSLIDSIASGDIDKIVAGGASLINAFRGNKATDSAKGKTDTEVDSGAGQDLAGSIAVSIFDHDVHAIVGATAVIRSMGDAIVDAEITQATKIGTASEATRKGTDDTTGNDLEISVAAGWGIFENDAQAIIQDNATIDAARQVAATAKIDYPMMLDSVTKALNPLATLKDSGLAGFESINDGVLGLSQLFNVQTKSLAGSTEDDLVLAAALVVTDFQNNVVAKIGDNAQINQDNNNPLDSNDQSVVVASELDAVLIDVGQMSAINLSVPGVAEAFLNNKTESGEKFQAKQVKDFFTDIVNPLGVSGKNAAGGAMLLALADNTTIAEIGQGAAIHTDDEGVTVKAHSAFHNVAVVQTGTGSTDFGFSAAISAADFKTTTRASIAPDVTINGGKLIVDADDTLDRISIVGAFLKGDQVGIGASVGVNTIEQNVSAYIGRADTAPDLTAPANAGINVHGGVTVTADASGDFFSLVMSGALQGFKSDTEAPEAADGAATTNARSSKLGAIALTVSVAYNNVSTNLEAYVDNYRLNVGDLTVKANSDQDIQSIVIGASFAVQTKSTTTDSSKLDLAGTGAVALNTIELNSAAFIKDSDVTATDAIDVSALDSSLIMSDGGGFAITAAAASGAGAAISFGASVAINDISSNVSALIDNVDITSTGNVSVKSKADTEIDALTIAGALSARGSQNGTTGTLAIGGALSINSVANTLTANVVDSTMTIAAGDLLVQAIDSSQINADAGGFAISAAVSGGTNISGGIGVGISLNDIDNVTTAKIETSPVDVSGNLTVEANAEAATIDALTIAASIGVAGGRGLSASLAGAGAVAYNEINNQVKASIVGGGIFESGGNINVQAKDTSTINSLTIGGSIAATASGTQGAAIAVGISIARNEIDNDLRAEISNTTIVADNGNVFVQTVDDSTIDAMAVAASLSAVASANAGLSLSGGGAIANNIILTDANASVADSGINAGGEVKLDATSESTITARVYGVFVAAAGSGSVAGSAAIGLALAHNFIGYDLDENHQSSDALATLTNVSIAAGTLTLNSKASQTIDSLVLVGSAAVTASASGGLGATGSGAVSRNLISKHVKSTINGSGGSGIDVATLSMDSTDTSDITADTAAIAIAIVASGTFGVTLSIGVSLASNEISNHVESSITNATTLDAASSASLSSNENATIEASSIAASMAAAVGAKIGAAIAGAGATADNQISNKTLAFVEGSTITGGGLDVAANSLSEIDAIIVSVSAAVGAGAGAGVGVAIGVALATNTIGTPTDPDDTSAGDRSSQIKAYIDNSSVDVSGTLSVESRVDDTIDATVVAGAVAAALGAVGAAVAGAGVSVSNSIKNDIQAYIEDSTGVGVIAGNVHVHACNESVVNALVGAASISAAAGKVSIAVSVSVALADNRIDNNIDAYIARSNVQSTGGVDIAAGEMATITSDAYAGAISISIGIGGALSGGGADVVGKITSSVDAHIIDSSINAGSVQIVATNMAISHVKTSVLSVALGLVGLAASGSIATSTVTSNTDANITGSDVTASGNVLIHAAASPHVMADAAGITAASGAAVGVSTATITTDGNVTANLDSANKTFDVGSIGIFAETVEPMMDYLPRDADGHLLRDADAFFVRDISGATLRDAVNNPITETPPSRAFAQGSSGGLLLGVDATITSATNIMNTSATIAENAIIRSTGETRLHATNNTSQKAESSSLAIGLIAAGVTTSTAESDTDTTARIGAGIQLTGGSLIVIADGVNENVADTTAGSGGLVSGAAAIPETINTSQMTAEVGNDANITLSGAMVVKANHVAVFNTILSATSGGLLAGAGGDVDSTVTSGVDSNIGSNATINATNVSMDAVNEVVRPDLGVEGNVDAVAGGLVAGGGVDSDILMTLNTHILIDHDTAITATDDVNLSAESKMDVTDQITFGSGGLGSGGSINATIETVADQATITFGDNVTVNTQDRIIASASGGGTAIIQANVETDGGLTVGTGDVNVDLSPLNEIRINPGSELTAIGDIKLVAGKVDNGFDKTYTIDAYLDNVAKSAIPISDLDATATLSESNRIHVASGAHLRSGGNIQLHADDIGQNLVEAQAKAVNWASELTDAVTDLFSEGGTQEVTGTVNDTTSGVVKVDGNVETGITRHRKLGIDSATQIDPVNPGDPVTFNVTLSADSTKDASRLPFDERYEFTQSSLAIEYLNIKSELARYRDVENLRITYEARLTEIEAELNEQGFLDVRGNLVRRRGLVISVDPIRFSEGSIDILGQLEKSGTIDAPSDTKVEIINNSAAFIRVEGITIPNRTGGVFVNNVLTSDVTKLPSILVDNVAEVSGQAWPGINVIGQIDNASGSLTLRNFASGAGPMDIDAPLNANQVRILGANAGNITINIPGRDTMYEVGQQQYPQWNEFNFIYGPLSNPDTDSPNSFGDGTGPIEAPNGVPNLFLPPFSLPSFNNQVTNHLNFRPEDESVISGASVFLAAANINLNGLIKSGSAEMHLEITQAMVDEIESLGGSGVRRLSSNTNPNFVVSWDLDQERIIVSDVQSRGGYVDITGKIANTKWGRIEVLSGYSDVRIDNESGYDIEVRGIDVSRRGEGTLIIKDQERGTVANPAVTIYERKGDFVYRDSPEGQDRLNATFENQSYQPKPGLRYQWTVAQEQLTRTTTTYEVDSFLGIDELAADPDAQVGDPIVQSSDPFISGSGAYLFHSPNDSTRYSYASQTETISNRDDPTYSTDPGFFIDTHITTNVNTKGTVTYHNHSIDADYPIEIDFTGSDEGRIVLSTDSAVYLAGELVNPTGVTTINTSGRDAFVRGTAGGVVGGRGVDIRARSGIGFVNPEDDGPATELLKTDIIDHAVYDYASSQSEDGTTFQIADGHRVLVASEHTAGGTLGEVYEYQGGTAQSIPTFNLTTVDFSSSDWEMVNQIAGATLISEFGHIGVHEVRGDLLLEGIQANRTANRASDGDVIARAAGSILASPVLSETVPNPFNPGDVNVPCEDRQANEPSCIPRFYFPVDGKSIDLISDTGSIGTPEIGAGVDVEFYSNVKNPAHKLSVQAAGDVNLRPFSTTIVDQVIAGGKINITAFGAILDGNTSDNPDERALGELIAVWDDLRLTEDRGAGRKRLERIDAIKSTQNQLYQAYWNFRSMQEDPAVYDPQFRVTLQVSEVEFYTQLFTEQGQDQNLSGSELDQFVAGKITDLEDGRTQQYQTLHETWGSVGIEYDPEFDYTLTADELDRLDENIKVWTEDELLNLQGVHLLEVTDTEFVVEQPNLVGTEIFVQADGGIGRYQNGLSIQLKDEQGDDAKLTLNERAALLAAEPGDIIYTTQKPVDVIASIDAVASKLVMASLDNTPPENTWAQLGFSVGQSIMLEAVTKDSTDEGVYYRITDLSGFEMTLDTGDHFLASDSARKLVVAPIAVDPDQATHIHVLRREDVDIESGGPVTAFSAEHIFLGSEADLALARAYSHFYRRVQVKVQGSITDANPNPKDDPDSPARDTVRGGRVVLEAGGGSIGTFDNPITLSTGAPAEAANPSVLREGGYLIARASGDVAIRELTSFPIEFAGETRRTAADLPINQVFSRNGTVSLGADGSIFDAFNDPSEDVRTATGSILLDAGGSIGTASKTLDIDVAASGEVTVVATDDVRLTETVGNLGIRYVLSENGDVDLTADISIFDTSDVVNAYLRDAVNASTITSVRVSQSSDDAEERAADGAVNLASTDVELGDDPGHFEDQTAGLRFQNVTVPRNSLVTGAYLEFTTDEIDDVPTSVTIRAQAADNAGTFVEATNNITGRPTTTASVVWDIPAWTTIDEVHRSPDLSALVEQVVNRPGWNFGNSIVFTIEGTGSRTAESFNGDGPAAPLLHIEHSFKSLPRTDVVGKNVTLTARNGTIGTPGNEVDVDSGYGLPDGQDGTLTPSIGNGHTGPFIIETGSLLPVVAGPTGGTTSNDPFDVTIYFGETVTGFESDDITVTGGTVTNLKHLGSGLYSATVDPSGGDTVTVAIVAAAATGRDGTTTTKAAEPLSLVVDSMAPEITVPESITVDPNVSGGADATLAEIATFLNGASATDDLDDNPTITNDAPSLFPAGRTTTVIFTATDMAGNSSSVSATVTVSGTTIVAGTLDVNGTGDAVWFRDGILLLRYMIGQPDEVPAVPGSRQIPAGSTRATAADIRQHLDDAGMALDVNGDGKVVWFQDGILILRYLIGQPDEILAVPGSRQVPAGSTRSTASEIRSYLETLMPTASAPALAASGIGESELASILPTILNPVDVNGDGRVTANDALNVINRLSQPIASSHEQDVWSRFDANQDGNVSAADALYVINRLAADANRQIALSQDDDDETYDRLFADDAFVQGLF
tara:strand:- start:721 stop:16071 length:15351 start_codon:yes stop_codon:yes gene_type:complete